MVSPESSSTENLISHQAYFPNPITHPPSPTKTPLIASNIIAQVNDKLTPSSFPQWHAQFEALFISYNLMDYVIGDNHCPIITDNPISHLQRTYWIRQDKLILKCNFRLKSQPHPPSPPSYLHSQNLSRSIEKIAYHVCYQVSVSCYAIERGNYSNQKGQ